MNFNIDTLPNGLRIITAPMKDAQSVTVQISVGVGSRFEDPSVNGGVSHFLEHLLFKGTKKRPSTKIISEQIDAVGGWCNAYTSNDLTSFFCKVPHKHGFLALDILCDMMRNSLFDSGEIDRERMVVIEEMNVYRDDPASFVHRLVPRLLWPNHPLSADVAGTESIIKNISRQAIIDHHAKSYVPGNMVISFAGKVDRDEAMAAVTKVMGDMEAGDIQPALEAPQSPDKALVESVEKDTAQTHLIIGSKAFPYEDRKTPIARVIATVLGRGLSSRLFLNVRERKGLAYSVNSNLESFIDTGEFSVYAGVNTGKTADAIAAIIEELQQIRIEEVGGQELSKAKNQLIGGVQMAMENNVSVSDRFSSQLILLGKIKGLEETIAEVNAVTAGDVKKVAAEMLSPANLRMGIISSDISGPTKAFEDIVRS